MLYLVTVKPIRPAFNDRGVELEIGAASKAEAISEARKQVRRELLYDRLDGPLAYSATSLAYTRDHDLCQP
jgi:hypothetical protein